MGRASNRKWVKGATPKLEGRDGLELISPEMIGAVSDALVGFPDYWDGEAECAKRVVYSLARADAQGLLKLIASLSRSQP